MDILDKSPNIEKVVIVAESVSLKMGGEASIPYYYYKLFQNLKIRTWLICHERVQQELSSSFSQEEMQQCIFVKDNWLQKVIWKLGKFFPYRLRDLFGGQLIHFITQKRIQSIVREKIEEHDIQLIFEPTPITAKGISFMYHMKVPVVIGPLCGGVDFPPSFSFMESKFSLLFIPIGRQLSQILNKLIPGKLEADSLIVANKRTEQALPRGYQGQVYEVVESGIDASIWQSRYTNDEKNDFLKNRYLKDHLKDRPLSDETVTFVFSGRLVDWKGVQFLLDAFKQVAEKTDSILVIIGDGELRSELEAKVKDLKLDQSIIFCGWLTRPECQQIICDSDVFVMPSLRECGGTAILESMALGKPIVTTKWGGPAEYVTPECGILADVSSVETFIDELAQAMITLAQSPDMRSQMGKCALERVKSGYYDWSKKAERVVEIFNETLECYEEKVN